VHKVCGVCLKRLARLLFVCHPSMSS
jgi:hypothetical protein